LCDESAKVECEEEDVLSCYKEILQAKTQAGTKQVYEIQIIQAGPSGFSACTPTQNVKLLYSIFWMVVRIANSRY
jgi:hypothetical protein